MKRRAWARFTVFIVVLTLGVTLSATAEAVSDWNQIAQTVIVTNAGRPPGAALVDFAYVHIAIYDAVNAIDGRYSVFAARPSTSPAGASPESATAAAAYTVLRTLFPAQQPFLDAAYGGYLLGIPPSPAKDLGITVGVQVANGLLTQRAGDGRNANVPYVFGSGPGVYQITPGAPPPPLTPQTPWIATMRPFGIETASQFRADGPPNLTSAQWAEDFNEVKAFGAATGSLRTAEQTQIGMFYLEHAGSQFSRNLRRITASQGMSVADTSRFFAEAFVTVADSIIACWDSKFYYNFWRPVTAIRAADTDGNVATQPDAAWLPLATTPPHPEYPAAHGCATGSFAYFLEDFFGKKKLNITLTSTTVPGILLAERAFANTQDIVKEIIDARIYGGMHYRTSGVHGTVIGKKVSHWVSKHSFRPIR
jgi:hypothetical protein